MVPEYQEGYSRINPAVLNKDGRIHKTSKIQRVLDNYLEKSTISGIILDIGCSGGIILDHLIIPRTQKIGIDIDIDALKIARKQTDIHDIDFICADGMNLPFRDNSIAITVCNHVYKHLPDSGQLFQEIFRTLKCKGICYCAAGNILSIMEGHYHLPFLSWLPKRLAQYYLRLTRRGDYYYEKHLTWWSLKRRIRMFTIHDYTIRIIKEPGFFSGTDMIKPGSLVTRIPNRFFLIFYPLIPTWIIILEKPNS